VRDASIVHENVQGLPLREFVENCFGARLIGDIASVGLGVAAGRRKFLRHTVGRFFIKIENPDRGALLREALRDGAANSTASAGNHGNFSVEPESISMLRGGAQSETPRFQGMKSFCASSSALV
jgi:hypothetical protein